MENLERRYIMNLMLPSSASIILNSWECVFFFKLIDYILSSFRFTDKLSETEFSYIPFSLFPVSPIINILSHCGSFVTTNETILRHYYELKSTVHFRVHSLTVHSMILTNNDMYLPLLYHTECACVHAQSRLNLWASWAVACQAPLSRQEYWRGLLFPSPEDLSDPGVKSTSPALEDRLFTTEPPGRPHNTE